MREKEEACPSCGEIKRWLYDAQICAACGNGDRYSKATLGNSYDEKFAALEARRAGMTLQEALRFDAREPNPLGGVNTMASRLIRAADEIDDAQSRCVEIDRQRSAAAAENDRLRAALAFYADRRNYEDTPTSMGWVMEDEGETAREALSEKV
jgi:hypothetical protein